MTELKIKITGPIRSGKSAVAEAVARQLKSLGAIPTIHDNDVVLRTQPIGCIETVLTGKQIAVEVERVEKVYKVVCKWRIQHFVGAGYSSTSESNFPTVGQAEHYSDTQETKARKEKSFLIMIKNYE